MTPCKRPSYGPVAYALIAALFLYVTWYSLPRELDTLGGFWMCLDYAKEGTLYGGQPYCSQGPLSYYLALLLREIFGNHALLYCVWAIVLSCSAATYVIFRRVLLKQGLHQPLLYPLLYALMVHPYIHWFDAMLASTLFFAGFYALSGSGGRKRAVAAGVLFSLAVFTKYITLLPIIVCLGYHVFGGSIRQSGKKVRYLLPKPDYEAGIDALVAVSIMFASFLLLNHSFAHLLEYTWYAQQDQLDLGSPQKIIDFIWRFQPDAVAYLLVMAAIAWCVSKGFFGGETRLYPLMMAAVLPQASLFVLSFGYSLIGSRYLIPMFPFMVCAYLAVWKKSPQIFAFLAVLTLVYPSIYAAISTGGVTPLHRSALYELARPNLQETAQRHDAEVRMIEWGFHYIPPQDGYILTEWDDFDGFLQRYNVSLEPEKAEVVRGEDGRIPLEDASWAPKLRKLANVTANYSEAYPDLSPQQKRLKSEIISGKFSLIIIGPPNWVTLNPLLSDLDIVEYLNRSYCSVVVPSFNWGGGGRIYTNLIFSKKADCARMNKDIYGYYMDNFDRICQTDLKGSVIVAASMRKNRITAWPSCESLKNPGYDPDKGREFGLTDLIIVVALALALERTLRTIRYFTADDK